MLAQAAANCTSPRSSQPGSAGYLFFLDFLAPVLAFFDFLAFFVAMSRDSSHSGSGCQVEKKRSDPRASDERGDRQQAARLNDCEPHTTSARAPFAASVYACLYGDSTASSIAKSCIREICRRDPFRNLTIRLGVAWRKRRGAQRSARGS